MIPEYALGKGKGRGKSKDNGYGAGKGMIRLLQQCPQHVLAFVAPWTETVLLQAERS